jgi:basic membrane lipoprotein Med (substrate-binding protein (PBP1-ABC) superfamily)
MGVLKLCKSILQCAEFSGSKISSYEKAIYNALKLAIKGKGKDEFLKNDKTLSVKLGESVFAEKLKQALKEAELKKEKKQMEKANDKNSRP